MNRSAEPEDYPTPDGYCARPECWNEVYPDELYCEACRANVSPDAQAIVARMLRMRDRFEKAGPTAEAIMAIIDEHHADVEPERRALLAEVVLMTLEHLER